MKTSIMSNRNSTIDIAKGIGSILVVLGHNWLVLKDKGEVYRIIYSFHIPLFLFLSGLFIKDSIPIGKFTLSRGNTLLKPYLTIILSITILKTLFPETNPAITVPPSIFFYRSLYATPGYLIWEWLPLWYIPHLFVALVLSKSILQITLRSKYREQWILGISITGLTIGIWITSTKFLSTPRPPFTSDVLPISVSIILFGFLLKEKITSMKLNFALFISAVFFFSISHFIYNETLDLSLRLYSHPVISTIQMILGIYIVLSASLLLNRSKLARRILVYIGSGSLFILLFHNFFQVRTYWILTNWGCFETSSYILGFIFGILFPLIFLELTKRQNLLSALFLSKNRSN